MQSGTFDSVLEASIYKYCIQIFEILNFHEVSFLHLHSSFYYRFQINKMNVSSVLISCEIILRDTK